MGSGLGAVEGSAVGTDVGNGDGARDGSVVVGNIVGKDVGRGEGAPVGRWQGLPMELPVVTFQPEVTWLERACNCAGTSEQNLFEYRYYRAGREGVISVSGSWTLRDPNGWWLNETCRQRETQAIRGCVRVYVGR